MDNKLADYAKLVDLEDFVLKESFVETQGKAAALADQFEVRELPSRHLLVKS